MRFWRRAPSLVSLVVLFAGVASGCRDRVWDFGYQVVSPDGGPVDAPKTDAPTDRGGTGGTVPQCDPLSPQRQTDISNCGTCFNSCLIPNSDPTCVAGVCGYTCF